MTVKEAILRIQSYPFYDIDTDTKTIRRNLNTADAKPELISSYLSEHQRITLVPKYKNGNAVNTVHVFHPLRFFLTRIRLLNV